MYSCVIAGPPCRSNTLMRGLLPIRFVQTLNLPTGVSMGIIFMPADSTPESWAAWYSATEGVSTFWFLQATKRIVQQAQIMGKAIRILSIYVLIIRKILINYTLNQLSTHIHHQYLHITRIDARNPGSLSQSSWTNFIKLL